MQTSGATSTTGVTSGRLTVTGKDAVEMLINDHQTIKALLEQLTHTDPDVQRTAVLEQLKAALVVHNATEENLVYPALHAIAGKKHESEHLYHETAQADTVIFKLDTMLKTHDTGGFQALADSLRAAILEHIEDEEQKAFPHLRDRADPQQTQLLTASVREFRERLAFGPSR